MDTFFAVLAAASAALTLAAGAGVALRHLRIRRQRHSLRQYVEALAAQADGLTDIVVNLDHRLSEGVGWYGETIPPEPIAPDLAILQEVTADAEATAARVRGLAADPSIERLRADVERAAGVLASVATVYRTGTMWNYRKSSGLPIPPGATGRDYTATLRAEYGQPNDDEEADEDGPTLAPGELIDDGPTIDEARRTFTYLFRSCLYQLRDDDAARAFHQAWPITRAEIFARDPDWMPPSFSSPNEQHPPIGPGY